MSIQKVPMSSSEDQLPRPGHANSSQQVTDQEASLVTEHNHRICYEVKSQDLAQERDAEVPLVQATENNQRWDTVPSSLKVTTLRDALYSKRSAEDRFQQDSASNSRLSALEALTDALRLDNEITCRTLHDKEGLPSSGLAAASDQFAGSRTEQRALERLLSRSTHRCGFKGNLTLVIAPSPISGMLSRMPRTSPGRPFGGAGAEGGDC